MSGLVRARSAFLLRQSPLPPVRPLMITRHPIESRNIVRACVNRARLLAADATGFTLATKAPLETARAVSSADLVARPAASDADRDGVLRVEAVSDHVLRIRYAEGASLPDPVRGLVIGELPPPVRCETAETGPERVVLRTGALGAGISLLDGRIEITDTEGRPLLGIGGGEENNFNRWDAHPTGILRTVEGGEPLAVERFSLSPGECVYGFGEKFIQLDKVGQTIDLLMDDALGVLSPRSYKNVPFYVSTRGYGVFFNHHSLMTAWVGSLSAVDVQVAIASGQLDFYVIAGNLREVLERYTALTGRPDMPPAWSFGLWQSKCTYVSAEETLAIARRLRAGGFPCDVMHVDTGWFATDWYCDLRFGPAFPDPAGWVRELGELGFKTSLWQIPYLPEGTDLFAEIEAAGGFVKNRAGEIYDVGICFVRGFKGRVGVIDFTHPGAVSIYRERLRRLFRLGVRAIKTDFGEQVPLDGVFHDGRTGLQMRNLYPLLYNTVVAELAREETGHAFVWARSAWAGGQRFPAHWGGDPTPRWSNLIPQLAGGLSLALSGFAFWSHDIGGFYGHKTDELLLIRWLQAGVFCSHPRIHGMGPQELDVFSPRVQDIARAFLRLRYRLLPYVLGQAGIATRTGLPLLRPLVLEFQDDPNTWRIADQFLFGDRLMVAPVYTPDGRRRVYLPDGYWFDWWTGKRLQGGGWIETVSPADRIPLYQRGGTVVPLGPVRAHVEERVTGGLELIVAPGGPAWDDQVPWVQDGIEGHVTYKSGAPGGRVVVADLPASLMVTLRVLPTDLPAPVLERVES